MIDIALGSPEETPALELPAASADEPSPGRTAWHYKHYDVLMREDGSRWELGRGAMGITYKAFDTNLHCPVALKIINSQLTDDPKARERFLREARAAARLRHPNVATVLHLGWDGDACFYAMEFIQGETLETFVARAGPLPLAQALGIAAQAARALGAAQSEGLVHRDIKPANIMLARHKGEEDEDTLHVKVIDFGLAKFAAEAPQERFVWDFPYFAGTPHFASPEQWAGEEVDGRSDIYSLGVTLWHMLTGAAPPRNGAATLAKETSQQAPLPLPLLADQPKCVQALLESMSATEKMLRPRNAAELLAAIDRCKADVTRPPRRRVFQWEALAVLVVVAMLICSGVYMARNARPASPQLPSVAVLPFTSVGENAQDQDFSQSVTKDLIAALARTNALEVISLSKAKTDPSGDSWPTDEAVVPAKATWLLKGSMRKENGKLRISARLFDVHAKHSVWGEFFDYDAQSADTDRIRSHLVRSILKSLQANTLPKGAGSAAAIPPDPPQADEDFRRGQEQARKLTLEGITQALEYYNRALELAPDSARVHAAIAVIYYQQVARFGFPAERLELAMQSARKAIELAPDEPYGYLSSSIVYSFKGEHWKALEQCRKALEAGPNYIPAINTFGLLWMMVGKPEKSLPWLHAALRITPNSPSGWFALGEAYKDLDNFEMSRTCFEKVLASDSARVEARLSLLHILISEGKLAQARQECVGALLIQPESTAGLSLAALIELYNGDYAKAEPIYQRLLKSNREGFVTFYGGIRYLSALGFIQCQLGHDAEGQASMREAAELDEKRAGIEFQSVYDLAAVRAAQGNLVESLALLRRTIEMGWVDHWAIRRDPRFAPLRMHPGFSKLTDGLREKMARTHAETIAAVSKPLKLADYPVPPQPR